jgi:ectoine hydroxylase-related dioxygenase (phytanoyl-CoA dioxygenase family)
MVEAAAGSAQARDPLARVMAQIEALGLTGNVAELEAQGYTIVRGVLGEATIARAKAAIIARVECKSGRRVRPEDEDGALFAGMQYIPYLIYDDQVFAEITLEAKPLALVTYLLGESCLLSSLGCHFRGPGGAPLMLHSDNGNGTPAPFSPISIVANVNYALTPYSREAGALVMVPGSHRLQRQPSSHENFHVEGLTPRETAARVRAGRGRDGEVWADAPNIVTMDIDPGDAVIWHGNTWHGSHVRTLAGVRMNLAVYFCRQFVATQERHERADREALVARHHNDPRLALLLGAKQPYGWKDEGPDYALMNRNPRGLYD